MKEKEDIFLSEKSGLDIVILGAGVAGIRAALDLEKKIDHKKSHIILIDENDYHQYLYKIQEVCNVDYEEKDIIVPISRLIKGKKITFKQTSVKSINSDQNLVETSDGEQRYDILVVALGSHIEYFGIEGLEENSLTLSNFEAAKQIRERIKELFQKAEESGKAPNIVVGGGGFTGVELAGEIADWYPILCKKHSIELPSKYVFIVEMMPTILPGWNEDLVVKGQKILEKIGVELILGDAVALVTKNKIELKSGKILHPDLMVWNGGVCGDPVRAKSFEVKGRRNSIDEYCRAVESENIYIAGDAACATNETGRPLPPTAHIAMVQGELVANNIAASLQGRQLKPYVNKHIGEIVTLGKSYAVGDLFGIKFYGFMAKFMKKVVHWWYLYSIGGFSLLLGN